MLEGLVEGVRKLNAEDLGIGVQAAAANSHTSSAPDAPYVATDDAVVLEIVRLAEIFGGVILSGPPGTSKSYYAAAAAEALVEGDHGRIRFVQFHASYQYEDFMLGFRPIAGGGFETKDGPFLELVRAAAHDADERYVLVIDELSRADVGRVFGEALTYIERSKRELGFTLANGEQIAVPSNLVLLATMNPFDRGVDEVDAAFERRFAKISMDPDRQLLDQILTNNAMDELLKSHVLSWFNRINGLVQKNPSAAVGHAYFVGATDEATLRDIWAYQLQYLVHRAFRRDEPNLEALTSAWEHIFTPVAQTDAQPRDQGTESQQ